MGEGGLMDEIVKGKDNSTESMKDALMRITNREAKAMMETTITHKLLKWLVVGWIVVSVAASIFRVAADRCDKKIELDSYFKAKLLCPVN